MSQDNKPDRFIRSRETCDRVGLTDRRIRQLEALGEFPRRFKINPKGRATAHLESDIEDYIRTRASGRVWKASSEQRVA